MINLFRFATAQTSAGLTPNPVGLLQPVSATPQQREQQVQNAPAPSKPATAKLGATWADSKNAINIDVDNLLGPKSPKFEPAPTINQLKSNPNSPTHARGRSDVLPPMGSAMPPMGNVLPPTGSVLLPVGNAMPAVGNAGPPVGNMMAFQFAAQNNSFQGNLLNNNNIFQQQQSFANRNSFLQ
ncbi:hypothetical protein EVAR_81447_1 [Eumeta japonica]|uniref:Uncharacterized protein n=1 Tax=Eumeta variegata TaxID=151549 RepID=A0A4C1VXX8_EUMVA|nr:hypothetical protein EVAR_81447_1 [Eumeta japonica]